MASAQGMVTNLAQMSNYSGLNLIRPRDNWASRLIGPDFPGHNPLPAHVKWPPLNWANFPRILRPNYAGPTVKESN